MGISIKNAAYGPKVVADGLVLALDAANRKSYPGTGTTWTDLSGNGNTGTLTNGPTYSSANGGSIVFDGVDDYTVISNPATFQNQNFTVSVWVNPGFQDAAIISMIDFDHSSSPAPQGWVLQSEDATTNRYYYLAWYDGTNFQPAGGYGAGNGIQVTTSSWQNIVYSKSGTTLIGYLNGVQVYTAVAGSSNVSYQSNRNFRIGNCIGSAGREFNGNISNARIYNRALTAQEIQQNFNATRGRYGI